MKFYTVAEIIVLIILWITVISLIILPLLPLWVFIITTRLFEEYIYEILYHAKRFNSEEIPWLHDDPKNLTIINSMLMMDGRVNVDKLRTRIKETLTNAVNERNERRYPRTTKYVHSGYLNNYWIEEENFKIEHHVWEWSSNEINNENDLKEIISELSHRALVDERNMSPWEYVVIHYKENNQSKSIIFMRSAHCLADGTSYVYYLVNELNEKKVEEIHLQKLSTRQKLYIQLKGVLYIPLVLIKLLFLNTPQQSALHTKHVSGNKKFAWSKPIKLQRFKNIKNELKVTVNDVLTGCLATNIHHYYKSQNETPPSKYRVCLPADTRMSLNEAPGFNNKFAILFFDIPTIIDDPLVNTKSVHTKMDTVKHAGEAFSVRYGLLLFGYVLPEFLAKHLNRTTLIKSSIVLSNVQGPQHPVIIAGRQVEFFTFWPPPRDTMGGGVSFMSYNGYITIGVGTDETMMKYPEKLIENFDKTLTELEKQSGLNSLDAQ